MRPERTAPEIVVLSERDGEVLASLARHGFLSFSQILRLHFPGRSSATPARRALGRLRVLGLAASARAPGSHRQLWHATPTGYDAAGVSRPRGTAQAVGGSRIAHTLAVNEFCVALAEAARSR